MLITKPSYEILHCDNGEKILQRIERIARTCYKSEDKITEDSAYKMIGKLIANGHEAMLEHYCITVRFICDRGVSHELVRHRMASFAQESTRYVNYQKKGNIEVIEPMFWEKGTPCYIAWAATCHTAEQMYFTLLNSGATPQQARSVLPTSLKTEVVISANLREWRYIFKLRCDKAAHPQMRELMIPLLADLQNRIPIVFDDISA